ncbi:hypothetical protein RvY_08920 [Ramazzottius varieornatus]|uniref:BEACH domain-containing protein n=1 Tax=Ramazzottius varieornatus TaxID=947166 RepID=A0A1D1VC50_RAMVA|nr:hypothetical protein RvY_08920 [Ramazzottius varieornatus]
MVRCVCRCFPDAQPEVERDNLPEEEKMNLLLNELQSNELLRRHGSSIHAMLTNFAVDTVSALDTVRYLCDSILGCPFLDFSEISSAPCDTVVLPNILAPVFVACMVDHFVLAFPYRPLTLTSCIRFSPALISTDAAASFVLFQLLFVFAYFQQNGFYLGDIETSDVLIKENLWIEVKPVSVFRALSRLEVKPPVDQRSELARKNQDAESGEDEESCKLSEWTALWCLGKISNYEYLHAINHAAGRDFTPDYYPIFPWVTDFSSPDGWRDLTRLSILSSYLGASGRNSNTVSA